jgi:hypothetical protein
LTFQYGPGGNLGWTPLAGVWNGSHATVGLYVPASGTFLLKDTNSAGPADMTFGYGPGGTGWTPLIGGWTCPSGGSPDLSRTPGVAPALVNAGTTGLTTAALAPVVQQAIAASGTGSANVVGQDLQEHWQSQWRLAGPSSAALVPTANTQVALGSVPGGGLAEPSPAADSGGLVDPMSVGDQELAVDTSVSPLPVLDPRAVDQLDLLAVVEQELGQS